MVGYSMSKRTRNLNGTVIRYSEFFDNFQSLQQHSKFPKLGWVDNVTYQQKKIHSI